MIIFMMGTQNFARNQTSPPRTWFRSSIRSQPWGPWIKRLTLHKAGDKSTTEWMTLLCQPSGNGKEEKQNTNLNSSMLVPSPAAFSIYLVPGASVGDLNR